MWGSGDHLLTTSALVHHLSAELHTYVCGAVEIISSQRVLWCTICQLNYIRMYVPVVLCISVRVVCLQLASLFHHVGWKWPLNVPCDWPSDLGDTCTCGYMYVHTYECTLVWKYLTYVSPHIHYTISRDTYIYKYHLIFIYEYNLKKLNVSRRLLYIQWCFCTPSMFCYACQVSTCIDVYECVLCQETF
jgi:hypothetical protein